MIQRTILTHQKLRKIREPLLLLNMLEEESALVTYGLFLLSLLLTAKMTPTRRRARTTPTIAMAMTAHTHPLMPAMVLGPLVPGGAVLSSEITCWGQICH